MAKQLSFPLPPRVSLARNDFFVAPSNRAAFEAIGTPENWPASRMFLVGPSGAGKSHLARLFAEANDATLLNGTALGENDIATLQTGPVALDDAQAIAGGAGEAALFHLYNLLGERRQPLLLLADRPAARWRITLPDLESRLSSMAETRIEPPDDALLSALLLKHFHDRQIAPPVNLIAYLVPRMERSHRAAAQLVADIDALSLSSGARVSRALAARVLDIPGEDAQ